MKCLREGREGEEMLLDHVAASLDTERAIIVAKHLDECDGCLEFVRAQSAVWEALDGFEAAPLSVDFDRRLYARIEEPVSWWQRAFDRLPALNLRFGLPAAATVAALLVGGVIYQQRPTVAPVKTAPAQLSAEVDALQPEQLENALGDMEMLRDFSQALHQESSENSKM